MKKCLHALTAILVLAFSSSCIRSNTVIQVKKDGAGSVLVRYHFSPQMLAMVEQLGALGSISLGGDSGVQAPNFALLGSLAKPSQESLEADAANYGVGVRYLRHEAGPDDGGWPGYTVEYAFDDIRTVRVDQKSVPGGAQKFVESSGQNLDAKKAGDLTFGLEDGVLTIHSTFLAAGVDGIVDQEQLAELNQTGMEPAEALQMASGMMEGMRVGVFVKAVDGITETNASHVNGNTIILSEVDIAEVLKDPDFTDLLGKAAADPTAIGTDALLEAFGKIEGMTFETAPVIRVKLP